MTPDRFAFSDITSLSQALSEGRLTSVALVELYLQRIGTHDPALNAFIQVDAAGARLAAAAADAARQTGHPVGPLHGIPIAVKDLCDIEGQLCTAGSAAWAGRRATATATIIQRLRDAGMIIIGRTQMVEFACGGFGTNAHHGMPRNPWDRAVHRAPGGSSSGSGVAVSAGLVPAAIGSDTSGSIRIPAAFCGLTGLKPTYGRVSLAGTIPLADSFDSLGPLARSVRDTALIHSAIQGADPLDRATLNVPSDDPLALLEAGIRGRRLAVLPQAERTDIAPDVRAAYDAALRVLEVQGAVLVDVPLPESFVDIQRRSTPMLMAEAYRHHGPLMEDMDQLIGPHTRTRILSGKLCTPQAYAALVEDRAATRARWLAALAGVDALLTPTLPVTAMRLEEIDEDSMILGRFTRMASYLGFCALSVPAGFDAQGLPVSLQIIGKPMDEARILGIGRAFQQASDWHKAIPAGWD